MDCIKYLNSYDEIIELVKQIQARRIFDNSILEHYRGQGRPEYKLVPSIARNITNSKIVLKKEEYSVSKLQDELKKENIEQVLRIDKDLNQASNLWNILIQAQHFGIQTRFLDWTLKWEVGLWFTVENPKNDDVDGQFWIFSVPNEMHFNGTDNNYYQKDITKLEQTYFINAPIYWSNELVGQIGEVKRQRQHGKFTISPYEKSIVPLDEQKETSPFLEKYCIPAALKGQIRLELASKGFHKNWLYYRDTDNKVIDSIVELINASM